MGSMLLLNAEDINSKIEQQVFEIEEHLHNREVWFGNGAVEDSLTPYTIISGNGVLGAEVLILDTTDTPVVATMKKYDLHRLLITEVSEATVYSIRIIWGTGTVAAAESAGQYTTTFVISTAGAPFQGGEPIDLIFPRIDVGTKVWIKCKNATNLADITLLVGIHEYNR